jgi:hypothetical protein
MNAEMLLRHPTFLSTLSRRLVLHEDSGDPPTQVQWEAALKRQRSGPGLLRGCLHKLIRASTNKKYTKGCDNREMKTEKESMSRNVSDPVDLMRCLVVEEVLLLDQPFLSPVLQHYYNRLPFSAVAEHYARSEKWAELRLKKSLKLLRKRLDARFGFDRRKWSTALTPMAMADLNY